MQTPCCDLCGADQAAPLIAGEAWQQALPAGLRLVTCQNCGLTYLNPRPGPDEIGAFYQENYESFQKAVEDERLPIMRWFRRRSQARRRLHIEKYSRKTSGSVLDVGCATGLFLHEMALNGWQTSGVEPTASAAAYARQRFGLSVFEGYLAEAAFAPASFDVLTFWDVLEHTFSPLAELKNSAALLKPGGLLAINVPNWDSPDRRWFGPHWVGYDPPRHLYVFTRRTLESLLEKAGFKVLAWECFIPSYFSFVISLERWLAWRSPPLARLVGKTLRVPGVRFLFEPYFSLANRLGRGGVIAVFAQKIA